MITEELEGFEWYAASFFFVDIAFVKIDWPCNHMGQSDHDVWDLRRHGFCDFSLAFLSAGARDHRNRRPPRQPCAKQVQPLTIFRFLDRAPWDHDDIRVRAFADNAADPA